MYTPYGTELNEKERKKMRIKQKPMRRRSTMKNKDRLGGKIQMEDLSPKDQEEVRSLINFRKRYRKERKHGNEKGDRTSAGRM